MAKGSRTYTRDARGRFASGNSGGGAKAAKPAAKAKPVTKTKPAPKTRTGRPAAKMKPVAQPASSKGAQRRSSGQANWTRGFLRLNDQGLTRNKKALLGPAQQEKAQQARRAYGTHNARKMSTRKLSDQQFAKAELARYRFGKQSTAPSPDQKSGFSRRRGQTGLQMAREFGGKLSAADRKLIAAGDRAAIRKYGKIDRLSIKEGGKSRYGAVIRPAMGRSGQSARVAALKARAAGESAGASFSKGLRAGERVQAQRSLGRAAGRAIGRPARQRRKQKAKD